MPKNFDKVKLRLHLCATTHALEATSRAPPRRASDRAPRRRASRRTRSGRCRGADWRRGAASARRGLAARSGAEAERRGRGSARIGAAPRGQRGAALPGEQRSGVGAPQNGTAEERRAPGSGAAPGGGGGYDMIFLSRGAELPSFQTILLSAPFRIHSVRIRQWVQCLPIFPRLSRRAYSGFYQYRTQSPSTGQRIGSKSCALVYSIT
jgi:hypothetical protein